MKKTILCFSLYLFAGMLYAQSFEFTCTIGSQTFAFTPENSLSDFSVVTRGPVINTSATSSTITTVTLDDGILLISLNPDPNWGLLVDLEDFEFSVVYKTGEVWGYRKYGLRFFAVDYWCTRDGEGEWRLPDNVSWKTAIRFLQEQSDPY